MNGGSAAVASCGAIIANTKSNSQAFRPDPVNRFSRQRSLCGVNRRDAVTQRLKSRLYARQRPRCHQTISTTPSRYFSNSQARRDSVPIQRCPTTETRCARRSSAHEHVKIQLFDQKRSSRSRPTNGGSKPPRPPWRLRPGRRVTRSAPKGGDRLLLGPSAAGRRRPRTRSQPRSHVLPRVSDEDRPGLGGRLQARRRAG